MPNLNITKPELVWPGKYDESGKRIVNRGAALPFQIIETIREGRATRAAGGPDLFAFASQKNDSEDSDKWHNKLIWGDNLLVMSSLLQQFAGKIDLIYIDPPFATGADFSFTVEIGESGTEVTKEQSIIEEKAYRDTWGSGADSYLSMMYSRLQLMHQLLSAQGSIYVHLDYRMASYIRCIMDEVFGPSNFRNEIIWQKCNSKNYTQSSYSNIHDTLLFYTKSQDYHFADVFDDHDPDYVERSYRHMEPDGRRYRLLPVHAPGIRNGATGGLWHGEKPLAGNHWRFHPNTLDDMFNSGLIVKSENGIYAYKKYLDDSDGVRAGTIWLDAKQLPPSERVDYSTQKPEAILSRIMEASSRSGDLIADFFCGSGTTLAVAEKLGRRWVGADLGRFAIHTTRKRLLGVPECKPFQILNLGQYERKYWQGVMFGKPDASPEAALVAEYVRFILELYQAQPCPGFRHIHGRKGRVLVAVGAVDAPVTITQVNEAVTECAAAGQKELHILGWEWEMGMNDPIIKQAKASHDVTLRLMTIPREVMEKRAVECGDIRFFDVAYLKAEVEPQDKAKRKVKVELKNFAIPDTELIPEEVRQKITKWSDYIDYWAIDWDYRRDTFMNQWQTYRTRTDRKLALVSSEHEYKAAGKYEILVKVVDIFGNDTSLLLEWKAK
jgi:DNA modification methylase